MISEIISDVARVSSIAAAALSAGWKQVQKQKVATIQRDTKQKAAEGQRAAANDVENMRNAHEQAQALALSTMVADMRTANQTARPASSQRTLFDHDYGTLGCPALSGVASLPSFNAPIIMDFVLDLPKYENLGIMVSAFESTFPTSPAGKDAAQRQAKLELIKLPETKRLHCKQT